ncbi:glutathione S-transferase [Aspergillus foveolatus]|uniref:glutathione S-transferase n=1 Tax=Aspergillus foveolatus TaxID=210207 RepID=UPI003CCE06A5
MSQPVYHYLALGRLGRGEVLNLFLKDAGIATKDVLYPYDETWPATSEKLTQQGLTRTGLLPALEYKGEVYTQHIPTLRFFARELGAYDGETSHEKYIVDAVADIYIDWRSQWVASLKGATDEYKNSVVPKYYRILGQYYSERPGPYLLGEKITYVDFAVYQSIDNERRTGTLPETLPESLVKLQEAIEARPNIKEYIAEHK